MSAIVNAFAEQGLTLAAILLLAIYLQAKIHALSTDLRKEMSKMKELQKELRKEMKEGQAELREEMKEGHAELRKEMADGHKALREEIAGVSDKVSKLTERVARIEGRLFPCSPGGECLDGTGGA